MTSSVQNKLFEDSVSDLLVRFSNLRIEKKFL